MSRASVQRRLAAIRRRIKKLRNARRFRLGRTRYWKTIYQARRKRFGPNDQRTRRALHKYRTSRALGRTIDQTTALLHRRAELKIKWLENHPPPLDPNGDGLVVIDGKQVATGIGQEVLRIRAAGRWQGYVVSGFRTPAYSESLCIGMCGAPSCPGRCAGRTTNHSRKPPEWGAREGAVDLTDYLTFAAECRRLGSWLENHLPSDLVHFSDAGN